MKTWTSALAPWRLRSAAVVAILLACNEGAEFSSGEVDKYQTKTATESFRAAYTEQQSYSFLFEQDTLRQKIVMQLTGDRLLEVEQIQREKRWEDFTQGHSGQTHSENFDVTELGKLDLLLVIDDSSSMKTYQEKLAVGLEPLLSNINNANWQLGVVTTTSACLRNGGNLITKAQFDSDPVGTQIAFEGAVEAGMSGSTTERGIKFATEGLIGHCGEPAQRWVRNDSHVAVLILTDEANCGGASNEGCPTRKPNPDDPPEDPADHPWRSADYFLNYIHANAPGAQFFGIIHQDDMCGEDGYLQDPTEYLRLIEETDGAGQAGRPGSICEADYSAILEDISSQITEQPRYRYELLYRPIIASLDIALDGVTLVNGVDYSVQGKTILVHRSISLTNDQLVVAYRHTPEAITDTFNLASAADPATVEVTLNGQSVDRGSYVVNGKTKVRFKQMPPERSQIRVTYRKDGALPNKFEVAANMIPDTVQAWIDGTLVDRFAVVGEFVQFEESPRDGQVVKFRYHLHADRIVAYDVPDIDVVAIESMELRDAKTGETIEGTLTGNTLTVSPEFVLPGNEAIATFFIKPSDEPLVVRFEEPIATDSVEVSSTNLDNGCVNDYTVEPQAVTFACPADDIANVDMVYEKLSGLRNEFAVETAFGSDHTEWIVKVDGEEIEDFSVAENVVTINPDLLSIYSEVEILVKWRENI